MKMLKRLARNFAFTAGLLLTLVLVFAAIAAPLLAPHDPNEQNTARRLEAHDKAGAQYLSAIARFVTFMDEMD